MEGLFWQRLTAILPEEHILRQEALSKHTTFRIGGPADYYAEPGSVEELHQLLVLAREENIPYCLLGRGSNVLVCDQGFRGLVIGLGRLGNRLAVKEDCFTAGSGVTLAHLAREAQRRGLSGLEFASGIPGLLGGAIYMNAGAYGGEMKDVLQSVTALTRDLDTVRLAKDELQLSYRSSIFQREEMVIVEADLMLSPGDPREIEKQMQELNLRRREKQPLELPSAGSTFKRPEGHYAGKLISDCGLKGVRVGGAQVSEKHAGFIVNAGGATAEDVLNLITQIRRQVWERFRVELIPEVRLLRETGFVRM